MFYPNSLSDGDVIELISPSNGVKESKIKKLDNALTYLQNVGFNVVEDRFVRVSKNGISASSTERAKELNNALNNTQIKALICCSGGDFLNQIMDLIDENLLMNNKKWIQGQSDATMLLYYLTTKYNIATMYNFNAKTYGQKDIPLEMLDNSIKFLKGHIPEQHDYSMNGGWKCLTNEKNFSGRIIGGCLESLKDIIGTKFDFTHDYLEKYKDDGFIWYFDIANMSNEDISRTLWQLKNAGWFKYANGFLFGNLTEEISYTGIDFENAIKSELDILCKPIILNVDLGHVDPVITIINGSVVKIINEDNKYLLETLFI